MPIPTFIDTVLPPYVPQGQEIYDMIMQGIEPDLTSAQMPLLDEKYKGETPEEKEKREDRYEKAFEEYDKQYEAVSSFIDAQEASYKHLVLTRAEGRDRKEESSTLDNLESALAA